MQSVQGSCVVTSGRTTWLPRDAATHDRELIVELGEEFGPAGPYALTVLADLAQQQRDGGRVRAGFRSLARKTFADVATVRLVIERAGEIGALDDLEVDEDGRRFKCRISGWKADQDRAKAAWKKAQQRAADKRGQEGDMSPYRPGPSADVPLTDQTRPGETAVVGQPPSLDAAVEEPQTVVASGKQGTARKRVDQDAWPENLPAALTGTAELIFDRLTAIHDACGSEHPPTRRGAGLAAEHFPDRDHAQALNDLEHWITAGAGRRRRVKDWAATYRKFASGAPKAGALPAGRNAAGAVPAVIEQWRDRGQEFEQLRARRQGPSTTEAA